MIITGMEHFKSVCKKKLVEWYVYGLAKELWKSDKQMVKKVIVEDLYPKENRND